MKLNRNLLMLVFVHSAGILLASGNIFETNETLKSLYDQYKKKITYVENVEGEFQNFCYTLHDLKKRIVNSENCEAKEKLLNETKNLLEKIEEGSESLTSYTVESERDGRHRSDVYAYRSMHQEFINQHQEELYERSQVDIATVSQKYRTKVTEEKHLENFINKIATYNELILTYKKEVKRLSEDIESNLKTNIIEQKEGHNDLELSPEVKKYYNDEHLELPTELSNNDRLIEPCPKCKIYRLTMKYLNKKIIRSCHGCNGFSDEQNNKNNFSALLRKAENYKIQDYFFPELNDTIKVLEGLQSDLKSKYIDKTLTRDDIVQYVMTRESTRKEFEKLIENAKIQYFSKNVTQNDTRDIELLLQELNNNDIENGRLQEFQEIHDELKKAHHILCLSGNQKIWRKRDIDDYVDRKNKLKNAINGNTQVTISDNIHRIFFNIKIENKSISELYRDLVIEQHIAGIIEEGKNDNKNIEIIGLINDLDRSRALQSHSLKRKTSKEKSIIVRWLWRNCKNNSDLCCSFFEQTLPEGKPDLKELITNLKQLDQLDKIGKEELDYKLFVTLIQCYSRTVSNPICEHCKNDPLEHYLICNYKDIDQDDIHILLSYANKLSEITDKEIEEVKWKFETEDQYLKDVFDTCMHLDEIINNSNTSFSEKIITYQDFLRNSQSIICKNLARYLQVNGNWANYLLHNDQPCECFGKENCTHKTTYALIAHSIISYFSLPKESHKNFDLVLKTITHPDKIGKDTALIFQETATVSGAIKTFNKMIETHGLTTDLEKIALYNIVKHQPYRRKSDKQGESSVVNFKSITKHLLIPCFAKLIETGTCDIDLLKETLIQTRRVISYNEIPAVISTVDQIIARKEISSEIEDELKRYKTKIVQLMETKKFDIWNIREYDQDEARNVNGEETRKLRRINLLTNPHHDFRSGLKKSFFQNVNCKHDALKQLNTLVENNPEKDQIEEAEEYYVRSQRQERREVIQNIISSFFSQIVTLVPTIAMQKYMRAQEEKQQQQDPESIRQFREYNKKLDNHFYARYCNNPASVNLYRQNQEKEDRLAYDIKKCSLANLDSTKRGKCI